MTGEGGVSEMFGSMLIAAGVLIGAVVALVVVGLVVYHRTEEEGREAKGNP